MSVTIELDLPEALVNEARANGLLEARRLAKLLSEEVRRERARERFGRLLKRPHAVKDGPMALVELQAEVDAVRRERRRGARRR